MRTAGDPPTVWRHGYGIHFPFMSSEAAKLSTGFDVANQYDLVYCAADDPPSVERKTHASHTALMSSEAV